MNTRVTSSRDRTINGIRTTRIVWCDHFGRRCRVYKDTGICVNLGGISQTRTKTTQKVFGEGFVVVRTRATWGDNTPYTWTLVKEFLGN